ncbi:MAG TPA: single-stranded-DNA-specific exonuclease RecJ [Gaiellales bacterium]|nr:single-stranded-DNA-specific exonuclease RecJ [Gaiellales bacterium]
MPATLSIPACCPDEVRRLEAELAVQRVTAEVLVRRGLSDPESARAFLESDGPLHDPFALGDMAEACVLIESAIAAGRPIVVHGDYDVDGVCSTALAVEVLRLLGAEVEPFLPSRFETGYGVAIETVEALAAAGTGLLITVDCGITAPEAVARARELSLDVVVTDHHRPGVLLPDAPIVATRTPSGAAYPFADLCGTGVVLKLAQALWSRRHGGDPAALPPALDQLSDLVALATVADVVPLTDENRTLVRRGLRRLAEADRPGLRALMASAGVDPARVRASDLSFRLAPRINAAGRLGDPKLALDLLLAPARAEAQPLAEQLEGRNRERQQVEDTILRAAAAEIARSGALERGDRILVAAGEGWHEGVIGIVASRLVERHSRPVVLIALDGERGKGSGRSVSAYDLHAGLAACSMHLERFGGHRAAAGLSITPGSVESFATALRAHAAEHLPEDAVVRSSVVDAVVAVGEVSLDLARELARFEPCGYGNPGVNLLVPGAQLMGIQGMGEGGKHLRLQVADASAHCGAVAWGRGGESETLHTSARHDVVCRLEVNDWRGALAPRLVLREIVPWPAREPIEIAPAARLGAAWPAVAAGAPVPVALAERSGRGEAALAALAGAGRAAVVLVADVERRLATLPDPRRYGARALIVCSRRGDPAVLEQALQSFGDGVVAVADHHSFARFALLRERAADVLVLDPPAHPEELAALGAAAGRVQIAAAESEAVFTRACVEADALRAVMAVLWRAAAKDAVTPLEELRARAAWPDVPPPADLVDAALAALAESGVVELTEAGLRPLATAGKSDLGASAAYALYEGRRAQALARLDALLAGRPAHPAAA